MVELGLILSTGRTGTQFFEDYLTKTSEQTLCLHEPKPSRKFKFFSNKYLQNRIDAEKICHHFTKDRKEVLSNYEIHHYIESNNFLFGCVNALNTCYENIKILHIIRHPEKYINSHLNHGFWKSYKKVFAKHVKYWLEDLDIDNEKKNDPVYVLISRWKYVNNQIATYKNSNKYQLIRFEDVFSKNSKVAVKQLNEIRRFFELPEIDVSENLNWLNSPKNISRNIQNKYIIKDEHKYFMQQYLKDYLIQYDYTIS